MTAPASRPRWTTFVCGMASYIDAASILTWSTILVIYQGTRGLTPAEIGLANGVLTAAIAIGAVVGGRLGDRFGRRPVFVATMALILLGAIGMTVAGETPFLLATTALAGLGIGADLPVSTSAIAEVASERSRGRLLGVTAIFWLAGSIIPGILAALVGDLGETGALLLLAHIVVITTLTLIARLTIPESAVWLAARAESAATRSLPRSGVAAARTSIADLLRPPYRRPFLALLVFAGLGSIGLALIGHYSTYMLVNFAGATVSSAALITIIAVPFGVAGALLFMKVAGGPRRFLYFRIAMITSVATALVPLVFGFSTLTFLVVITVGAFAGSFCGDALSKLWTQRSFPTLLRNTAQGGVFAVARLSIAIFTTVGPLLLAIDVRVAFAVMALGGAIAGLAAWSVFRTWDARSEFSDERPTGGSPVRDLEDAA